VTEAPDTAWEYFEKPSLFTRTCCQVPLAAPPHSTINVKYCTLVIEHAVLRSVQTTAYLNVAMHTAADLFSAIRHLEEKLESLKQRMSPMARVAPSQGIPLQQALFLQHMYCGTLSHIHFVLADPWSHGNELSGQQPSLRAQIAALSSKVADAARFVISTTTHVPFNDKFFPARLNPSRTLLASVRSLTVRHCVDTYTTPTRSIPMGEE